MEMVSKELRLTPSLLCRAYAAGIFPMAQSRGSSKLIWIDPEIRGILPLDKFRMSRRDARALRKADFYITIDNEFATVVRACAERSNATDNECRQTWINAEIEEVYGELHRQGRAHSIEVYSKQGDATTDAVAPNATSNLTLAPEHRKKARLVGGLYGVALGAAFFGESMFSREKNASKAALRYLVECLGECGFELLDVQFQTPHLKRFGVVNVSRQQYHRYLQQALQNNLCNKLGKKITDHAVDQSLRTR